MPLAGRIEGRKSDDGTAYVVCQGRAVLRKIPLNEAMTDAKLARIIQRNGWESL